MYAFRFLFGKIGAKRYLITSVSTPETCTSLTQLLWQSWIHAVLHCSHSRSGKVQQFCARKCRPHIEANVFDL